jgi:hypothetical protein
MAKKSKMGIKRIGMDVGEKEKERKREREKERKREREKERKREREKERKRERDNWNGRCRGEMVRLGKLNEIK